MRAAPLVLFLLLAGCATPVDLEAVAVEAAAFDAPTAPWRAVYSSGCGMCAGDGVFQAHAEHTNVWLLDDGRAVMAEFNGGLRGDGETRVRLADDITFDQEALAGLFEAGVRGEGAEAWVVRVTTGRLASDVEPRLEESWRDWSDCDPVTDFGEHYAWRSGGGVEEKTVTCIVAEDEPFSQFQRVMRDVREGLRERGHVEGIPRD